MKSGGLGAFGMMLCLATQPASGAASQQPTEEQAALSQCVVLRTTGADRVLTAQWIFAAMTKSPHIADLSVISDQRKAQIDRSFGQLLTRIVMKDCLEQIRPLASHDLQAAFELTGQALGEVAMQELMGNERVDKAIGDYTDYLSEDDFKLLIDSLPKDHSK